jgi:pyruvate dehydrogenase E2 component (dihydrolipoamide acetyltransferase)
MAKELTMPVMAESIVEVEILKWLVNEGDEVKEGQMVAEIMTDKVTQEIPAPFAGKIEKIVAKEGSVVQVKDVIALVADGSGSGAGAAPSSGAASDPTPPATGGNAPATNPAKADSSETPAGAPAAPKIGDDSQSATSSATNSMFGVNTKAVSMDFGGVAKGGGKGGTAAAAGTNKFGRPLAVPAARKIARENDVDIATVPGSGPNGRVGVADVRGFLEKGSLESGSAQPQQAPAAQPQPASTPAPSSGGGLNVPAPQYKTPKGLEHLETRTPLRGLRRVISNAMVASHLHTVRTLTVDEVDFSKLVEVRERLKPIAEKAGVKLTYLPFIFKAVASALKAFPNVNSSYDEAANEIVHKRYYNIGCAVDTEAGLIVPVVKNVDSKSVMEIARDIVDLAGKARDGKLASEEISGSSFAVTNIGSAGSLLSFPIINAPDAAILGVHTIVDRPIVRDGQIVVGKMMYLSLSFDHRLIDGAEAARFVKHLTRLLENPDLLLLEAI